MYGEVDVDHLRSEAGDLAQVRFYIEPDERMPVRLRVEDDDGFGSAYLSARDAERIADALMLAARMARAARPLQKEIDRLRDALQFYADQHMYEVDDHLVPVNIDCGRKARDALGDHYVGAKECKSCV